MQELDLFSEHFWKPFEAFGFKSSLLYLNAHTIIYTWCVLLVLLIVGLTTKYFLKYKSDSMLSFMILSSVHAFKDLFLQNIATFYTNHFYFIFALFIFILTCNLIAIIPFIEEPTTDVNTTLALGIIAFMYVQISMIRAHGIKEYVKEYFAPFFLLFPLNVIGELAKVISLSFRLFGNIFGGSIISRLWITAASSSILTELLAIFSGINLIIVVFFILFEGFIQAFVFTMLTLTYLSVAIQNEEDHIEEESEKKVS
ncbi:MAG: F0F1 ATP synthase subunit A [Candidatus Babeliales bacterium]|nr:F0F1 ATP synthase subunit A [Candidatus Babeliales bacterium]